MEGNGGEEEGRIKEKDMGKMGDGKWIWGPFHTIIVYAPIYN